MKLFKKPKSKFYWYDFTVRGCRYRSSTQETKFSVTLQPAFWSGWAPPGWKK